ncbi:MAG: class I SAM-dependent methyltransferase [Planctomycetota bacterium]|nr:class I SAM-dependent methyltransferase [Planctomycetota bacterium]
MSSIGDRYKDGGLGAHLYRWLRLDHGGLAALAGHLPPAGLIVDLGSGAGLLAHLLVAAEPARRVVCVDHDAGRIASLTASATGLPIEGVVADLSTWELPRCAGIALVDVLHYLDAPQQEALLDRCAAALEPGGVLVLRDPDPDGRTRFDLTRAHERVATGLGFTKARVGHYRRGAEWSLQLRVRGLGTTVERLPRLSPFADRTVVGTRA